MTTAPATLARLGLSSVLVATMIAAVAVATGRPAVPLHALAVVQSAGGNPTTAAPRADGPVAASRGIALGATLPAGERLAVLAAAGPGWASSSGGSTDARSAAGTMTAPAAVRPDPAGSRGGSGHELPAGATADAGTAGKTVVPHQRADDATAAARAAARRAATRRATHAAAEKRSAARRTATVSADRAAPEQKQKQPTTRKATSATAKDDDSKAPKAAGGAGAGSSHPKSSSGSHADSAPSKRRSGDLLRARVSKVKQRLVQLLRH